MKTNLNQKQNSRITRRTITIIASSSIFLIILALLFVFNIGNIRHGFSAPVKRTVTTVKDGNWSDNTIWSTGSAPTNYSSDSIVILNKVSFNVDYTVGNQTKTGISIGSNGQLSSTGHTLTLEKSASLSNAGKLSITTLTFNGNGATDPSSTLINSGTFTILSSFSSTNLKTIITNSGTMTITGDFKINGTLSNSGTISINGTGNFNSDYGTINNSGTISAKGSCIFTGAILNNTTSSAVFTISNTLTMNYGSSNSSISKIINKGTVTIGTIGEENTTTGVITINDGSITNGPTYVTNYGPKITLNGSMVINSPANSDTNSVLNNGIFTILKSLTSSAISIITNNDSLTIGTTFSNASALKVNKYAYLGIGTDFTNNTGTLAGININGGYISVSGNFTNATSAVFTGTKGGLSVAKNFINRSSITGTTDICDKTPNTAGDVNGTLANTLTKCSFTAPTSGPSALPVTLISFSAKKEGSKVGLFWATASEINNDRFEIERSEDGSSFSILGSVKGNGNKATTTTYTYDDENPLAGIAYYRLHQYDFNGKSEYSTIVVVHATGAAKEALSVNVYPNPVSAGNILHLELNVPVAELVNIEIIDMAGVNIYKNESQLESGRQDKVITLPGNLKNGIYILNIVYQGQVTSKKISVK